MLLKSSAFIRSLNMHLYQSINLKIDIPYLLYANYFNNLTKLFSDIFCI